MVHSTFEYHLIQEEDRRLKVALAKKLKAQRKTKRQTIAEILGESATKKDKGQKGMGKNQNRRRGSDSDQELVDDVEVEDFNGVQDFENDEEGGQMNTNQYEANP